MKYEISLTATDVAIHLVKLAARDRIPLDPMKIQKLLYYVQCWHLSEKNSPLFPERFKAWIWGPVVPSVWHEVSGNESDLKPDLELNQEQANHVESVWMALRELSSTELSSMTHEPGMAWKKARADTPEWMPSSNPLNLDDMRLEVEKRLSDGQKWVSENLDDLRRECA